MPVPRKRDDNWVDGLRGIASFIIVTGHICTAFTPYLHSPAPGERQWPLFFQLPILRLCVAGRAAVAIFFILTGYVNSLNPLKNATAGNPDLALSNLAKSAFARPGRLVFPTNAAAFVAWLFCQMGAFNLAKDVDADWIRGTAREPGPTFWEAMKKLYINMTLFWHDGDRSYDPTHWSVVFFLWGSMLLYLTLLATTYLTTKWRMGVVAALYIYSWASSDYLQGINIYAGLMLAQLQNSYGSHATSLLPRPLPPIIITTGLFIISFPQDNHDWMAWSSIMHKLGAALTPATASENIGRYWVSVGCTILFIGIFFSRDARRVLTLPLFNFLGRVSFPVYLLHNTLLRSLLVWMVYGASAAIVAGRTDDQGSPVFVPRGSTLAFVVAIPVYFAVLYGVAHLWAMHVDPLCAKAVVWLRREMFRDEEVLGRTEKMEPAGLAAGGG